MYMHKQLLKYVLTLGIYCCPIIGCNKGRPISKDANTESSARTKSVRPEEQSDDAKHNKTVNHAEDPENPCNPLKVFEDEMQEGPDDLDLF